MELGYQQVIMAEADDLGPFLLDGRSTPALRFHLIALRDRYDLQVLPIVFLFIIEQLILRRRVLGIVFHIFMLSFSSVDNYYKPNQISYRRIIELFSMICITVLILFVALIGYPIDLSSILY